MANNLNPKKVEAARILYLEGYDNIQIAAIVGVNQHTVGRLAKKENWAGIKLNREAMDTSAIANLMEVFVYQADCLKRQKDDKLANGDYSGMKAGDFDAMQKFYNVIKQDMKNYKMFARVITDLLEYLEQNNLDLAKALAPAANEYLRLKQSTLL